MRTVKDFSSSIISGRGGRMDAATIAKSLGGRKAGDGYLVPCPVPGHGKGLGDRNPSLSIRNGERGLLIYCHAGCSVRDVHFELRICGLLDPDHEFHQRQTRPTGRVKPNKLEYECRCAGAPRRADSPNRDIALKIWNQETVLLSGTLGADYFTNHRQLNLARLDDVSHCLRWHPDKLMIIALMTNPVTNEPTGVHRTFLNADGSKHERKMLGLQGVIRLSPDDTVSNGLGICEGIEDGLAVLLSGWSPVWVATSARAIRNFPVLSGIEALTIFADPDTVGMEAAWECAARWLEAECEAKVSPPQEGANV